MLEEPPTPGLEVPDSLVVAARRPGGNSTQHSLRSSELVQHHGAGELVRRIRGSRSSIGGGLSDAVRASCGLIGEAVGLCWAA